MSIPSEPPIIATEAEVDAVRITRELIRIDSSNYGDGSGPGERAAAEYVMGLLTDAGYEPTYFESAPKRASVVLRVPGRDRSRPALVVHGHLDVVPAEASEWKMDPFGGEEMDGMIWGRGAVDMKDMDAMILAALCDMKRNNWQPARDLIVAFFADEEHGGKFGARYAVENKPELFEGATEAISEVGGYSVDIGGRRAYLLQTAEKGLAWLKLVAEGTAGHGSQINTDNALTRLAGAIARIGQHEWPLDLSPTVAQLLDGVAELTSLSYDAGDRASIEALASHLGSATKFVSATFSTNANPSRLDAGYKANVIPSRAEAVIDVRFLPGKEEETLRTLAELAGEGVRIEDINRDIGLEVPFEGALVERMVAALEEEDPGAVVLPYMLSGGTDNKSLARQGITGYGFAPLRLPADMDFAGMFHGVDERVPVDSVQFGVRVLMRLLREC